MISVCLRTNQSAVQTYIDLFENRMCHVIAEADLGGRFQNVGIVLNLLYPLTSHLLI